MHIELPVADVYVLGVGLRLPNDLTLETIQALKASTIVFGVPPIDLTAIGVPQMENLMLLYGRDKPRVETYREIASRVVEAAGKNPPVSFVTYGSPIVGTYPAHLLRPLAAARGLRVHVSNSCSSIESLCTELAIEPFLGLQTWDATHFVALQIEPAVTSNLFLTGATAFGICTAAYSKSRADMTPLRDHLLSWYPPTHPVALIRAEALDWPSSISWISLRDLSWAQADESTLFVPRQTRKEWAHSSSREIVFGPGFVSPAVAPKRNASAR